MVALSTSFQSVKEDLLLQRIGEQPMLMLEQEPWNAVKQEASARSAAAGAGNQRAEGIEEVQCAHLQEKWDAPRAVSGGTATSLATDS
ncbi:unnamed protein product [Urochloa humidicola]